LPTDTPTPTPTPTPSTGRLEGKLAEATLSNENKGARPPLTDALVALCLKTAEKECTVDAALTTNSDNDRAFVFETLSPGEYVLLYNPFTIEDEAAYWEYWDRRILDLTDAQTLLDSAAPAETMHISAGSGGGVGVKTNPVTGQLGFSTVNKNTAIWLNPYPLVVEFVAEQTPVIAKIEAGQTESLTIQTHATIPDTPTPTPTVPPPPTATPTPVAGIGVPVASQNWEVTIRDVRQKENLTYVIGSQVRGYGGGYLLLDVRIRALSPALRATMEGQDLADVMTSLVTIREGKSIWPVIGGGPDSDNHCITCQVEILPGNGVKYDLGDGLEDSILYPSDEVLYDGELVFGAHGDLTGQVFEFEFQDVPSIFFSVE